MDCSPAPAPTALSLLKLLCQTWIFSGFLQDCAMIGYVLTVLLTHGLAGPCAGSASKDFVHLGGRERVSVRKQKREWERQTSQIVPEKATGVLSPSNMSTGNIVTSDFW